MGVFSAALLVCVVSGISIFWALGFACAMFAMYGRRSGFGWKKLGKMAVSGMMQMKTIFVTFIFIGMLTAAWRLSGTIPYIVYYATGACSPKIMLLLTFLLCAGMSMLTGTAFGTAATMGVICVTMASSMGIPLTWAGGAMLSGIFVGDRASPVSTCALLVASITGTDHYTNVKRMLRSAIVPFILTASIYALTGLGAAGGAANSSVRELFAESFVLNPVEVIPAAIVVVLAIARVKVIITMSISIVAASAIAITVQKVDIMYLLKAFLIGFTPENAELAAVLSGGGVKSMLTVYAMLIISGFMTGIFKGTGFMVGMSSITEKISDRITPFGCVILMSIITVMISCNQSLSTILTQQLCAPVVLSKQQLADDLNNSVVTIAGLIPWSIACNVPLTMTGATVASAPMAFFLFLVPICTLAASLYKNRRTEKTA